MDKQKASAIFDSLPVMKFNLDPIDHPKYGYAKLCGEIPFLLPFRGHTMEQIMPDLDQCRKTAEELIQVGRAVWPDEDDETVLERVYEYVFSCTLMSGMSVHDPRNIIFPYAMLLFIGIDDQLDTNNNFEVYASSYKDFVEEWRSGEYIMREFPCATADLTRLLKCWDGLRSLVLEIPDFIQKYRPGLKKEFGYYVATNVALQEFKGRGLTFSDSTTAELLRNVGAPLIGTELVAIVRDVCLPDYVRKDVLFDVVRNTTSDIEVLMNALFGLPRDLKLGQIDSPIMCPVEKGKLDLQTSCNQAHMKLLNALHDFKIATDKLLEVYPDDRNVVTYVDILRTGMDGMLYSYKFVKRYKIHDKLTIIEKCETVRQVTKSALDIERPICEPTTIFTKLGQAFSS